MAYADYDFYQTRYIGQLIPAASFERYIGLASRHMDYVTMGRLADAQDLDDGIGFCACELADAHFEYEDALRRQSEVADNPAIKSETTNKYKVEYETGTARIVSVQNRDTKINAICRKYLTSPENYMYVGVTG